jgi:hypothetical protein
VFRFISENHWFLLITLTKIGFLKVGIQQHHQTQDPQLPRDSEWYTDQALRGGSKSATTVNLIFLYKSSGLCTISAGFGASASMLHASLPCTSTAVSAPPPSRHTGGGCMTHGKGVVRDLCESRRIWNGNSRPRKLFVLVLELTKVEYDLVTSFTRGSKE